MALLGRYSPWRVLTLAGWFVLFALVLLGQEGFFWRDADHLYRMAQQAFAEGQTSQAMQYLEQALDRDPENAELWAFKGWRQLDEGEPDSASVSFELAMAVDMGSLDAQFGAAEALLRRNMPDSALVVLRGMGHPPRTEDCMRLAGMLERAGDLEGAYAMYSLAPDPSNLEMRANLAMRIERFDEAVGLQRQILGERPGDEAVLMDLAYALGRSGQPSDADAIYRELDAQGSLDVEGRARWAWLLNTQRRYREAWQVLEPLPRPADDPELAGLQARTAFWAGEWDEAKPLLNQQVAQNPYDTEFRGMITDIRRAEFAARREAESRRLARYPSSGDPGQIRAEPLSVVPENVNTALGHYSRLLAEQPDNPEVARQLEILLPAVGRYAEAASPALLMDVGRTLESREEYPAAITAYEMVFRTRGPAPPEAAYRIARLNRWMGDPASSLPWFELYAESGDETFSEDEVALEWARALEDLGLTDQALDRVAATADRPGASPETLLFAASVASAAGQSDEAGRYLDLLNATAGLSDEQKLWLAGMYRASGRPEVALARYESVAGSRGDQEPRLWETVGDLRAETGDFAGALDAYDRAAAGGRDVLLKRAWVVAETGDLSAAERMYLEHLERYPEDGEAWLGLARARGGMEAGQGSWEAYQRAIELRGAQGLAMELTLASLSVQRFEEAERWALLAENEEAEVWEPRLARALAVRLQGRRGDADELFDELLARELDGAEQPLWWGRVAMYRGRSLEAYRHYGDALEVGVDDPAAVWTLRGEAAVEHGDYGRAEEAFQAARELGADPQRIAARTARVDSLTAPELAAPVTWSEHEEGLKFLQAAGTFELWPTPWFETAGMVRWNRLEQGSLRLDYTSFGIEARELFAAPSMKLGARAGVDVHSEKSTDLFAGIEFRKYFEELSELGFSFSRETIYTGYRQNAFLNMMRVYDLDALGSAFYVNQFRASGTKTLGAEGRMFMAEAGWGGFEDGNDQFLGSVGLQLPLVTDLGRWVTLTPNAYWETFGERASGYFSPENYVKLGVRAHAIMEWDSFGLDGWVDPFWFRYPGESGGGVQGTVSAFTWLGPVRLDAGGHFFTQSDRNRYYSVFARFSLPLR